MFHKINYTFFAVLFGLTQILATPAFAASQLQGFVSPAQELAASLKSTQMISGNIKEWTSLQLKIGHNPKQAKQVIEFFNKNKLSLDSAWSLVQIKGNEIYMQGVREPIKIGNLKNHFTYKNVEFVFNPNQSLEQNFKSMKKVWGGFKELSLNNHKTTLYELLVPAASADVIIPSLLTTTGGSSAGIHPLAIVLVVAFAAIFWVATKLIDNYYNVPKLTCEDADGIKVANLSYGGKKRYGINFSQEERIVEKFNKENKKFELRYKDNQNSFTFDEGFFDTDNENDRAQVMQMIHAAETCCSSPSAEQKKCIADVEKLSKDPEVMKKISEGMSEGSVLQTGHPLGESEAPATK